MSELLEKINGILKRQKRSLLWLATEMQMTDDGLKASLNNESLKYRDLLRMAEILNIPVRFFVESAKNNIVQEEKVEYQAKNKVDIENLLRENIKALKEAVKAKDELIEELRNKKSQKKAS